MGTLPDFRSALRLDLNDPSGPTQRFSDPDLTRAITRATADLSLAAPKLTDTELLLTTTSRTIPLPSGTFPNLIAVQEIEHPYGTAGAAATLPPTLAPFRLAPDRASALLLTDDIPAAGARLRIRWSSPHSIQEASTTVPTDLDTLIALGAAGYAMQAYSTPASDNFKYDDGATVAGVDDSMIPREWRARAEAALAAFHRELARLRSGRALGSSSWITWSDPSPAPAWPLTQPGLEP